MGLLSKLFGEYEKEPNENRQTYSTQEDVIYVNGEKVWLDDEAKDFLRQYEYYLPDAKEGIAEAQFEVGKCLFCYGQSLWYGLERKKEAVYWLVQAAAQGIPSAYTYLGRYYTEDRFQDVDYEKGIGYLAKGAKLNDSEAYYRLGILYEKGYGVDQDISKSIQCKEKAVSLGNVDAAESLGEIFYDGEIVEQDKSRAFPYLKMAFEHGETHYGYYLACCYMYGDGVEKNERMAVRVLEGSCVRDKTFRVCQKEAQEMLIYCYENGVGCEVDYREAERIRQMKEEDEAFWDDVTNLLASDE